MESFYRKSMEFFYRKFNELLIYLEPIVYKITCTINYYDVRYDAYWRQLGYDLCTCVFNTLSEEQTERYFFFVFFIIPYLPYLIFFLSYSIFCFQNIVFGSLSYLDLYILQNLASFFNYIKTTDFCVLVISNFSFI
jgi:hypothetical protein